MKKREEHWINFAKTQKLCAIGTTDGKELWITNVFYMFDDQTQQLYFISADDTKHSQHILKHPNVSFAIAWHDESNHTERKGIQGTGQCYKVEDTKEIEVAVRAHNERYPEFKERITTSWIESSDNTSNVWVIKPTYVKYWDDERYGENEIEQFYYES